jgi:hypothetical protein
VNIITKYIGVYYVNIIEKYRNNENKKHIIEENKKEHHIDII